jgi:hypothetical protein
MNPYGMTFHEIPASSLVKVDLGGNQVMDSPHEINPAGFTIHCKERVAVIYYSRGYCTCRRYYKLAYMSQRLCTTDRA